MSILVEALAVTLSLAVEEVAELQELMQGLLVLPILVAVAVELV
jgi:hypothetical protein